MKVELRKSYWLESARSLPHLPAEHPCHGLHGHSFQLTFVLIGELAPGDHWLMDYNEIDERTAKLRKKIDHKNLNEILEAPTTERLTHFIFEEAKKDLPYLKQVILAETRDTECRYPTSTDL